LLFVCPVDPGSTPRAASTTLLPVGSSVAPSSTMMRNRQDLITRVAGLAGWTSTEILAWALLPNHFHLLLRTGATPVSDLMRCLNTGYAVRFNRWHHRSGYLFQNRFKSFLVEEDPYLLELVRYIHLNPLRARLITTLEELDTLAWTGHSALLGHIGRPWQAQQSVLTLFGGHVQEARARYRQFIADGMADLQRPELAGGGLRRSRGAWRRRPEHVRGRHLWAFDERILGSGEFVEQVLAEDEAFLMSADLPAFSPPEATKYLSALLQQAATRCDVVATEIASSSHRPQAVVARTLFSTLAVLHLGISANVVARFLGVSRQSVRRGLQRSDHVLAELGCDPAEFLNSLFPREYGKISCQRDSHRAE